MLHAPLLDGRMVTVHHIEPDEAKMEESVEFERKENAKFVTLVPDDLGGGGWRG